MYRVARDVAVIKTLISNAYLVGNSKSWVLVDCLAPGHVRTIKHAAEACFGPFSRPEAILLTHGHIDHVGSAAALADYWGVKIYAHRLERPYLTGRSSYPPLDATAPGFFSGLSRLFPSSTSNLGNRLADFDPDRPLPWLSEWTCYFTPGHAPGHVAFFRHDGNVLLAGDAVTTMNLDSFVETVTQERQLCGPPVPGTMNWRHARDSVTKLASLRPALICAGHGRPMAVGPDELAHLADHFAVPPHGRYVKEPAITDEDGIKYLPPAPFDVTPKLVAAAALTGIAITLMRKRHNR